MSRIAAIALITFREAIRSKAFIIPLLFGAVVLGSTPFTPAFNAPDRIRVMLSVATGAIALLTAIVAVFVSTSALSKEIDDKRLFTVLTRPISRLQFILGKVAGLWLLLAALLFALGVITWLLVTITSAAILEPQEKRSVLAANVHLPSSSVQYPGRSERQVLYDKALVEYDRILLTAKELYAKGVIPANWKLKDILEHMLMSDADLQELFPDIPPRKVKRGLANVLSTLTGENFGPSVSAWNEYFTKNPRFGRKPRNPDNTVELPAGDWNRFFAWEFDGMDESDLKDGLRCELDIAIYRDPRVRTFDSKHFTSTEGVLTLVWKGDKVEKRIDIFNQRTLVITFEGDIPPPGTAFSLVLSNPPGPASMVMGAKSLRILKKPGFFSVNLAKSLMLSWCVAALLAAVGVFASSFLTFPVALMLCMFVLFWGETVGSINELLLPPAENPLFTPIDTRDQSHKSNDLMSRIADAVTEGAGVVTTVLSKGMEDFGRYEGGQYVPKSLTIPWELLRDALWRLLVLRALFVILLAWVFFHFKEF